MGTVGFTEHNEYTTVLWKICDHTDAPIYELPPKTRTNVHKRTHPMSQIAEAIQRILHSVETDEEAPLPPENLRCA